MLSEGSLEFPPWSGGKKVEGIDIFIIWQPNFERIRRNFLLRSFEQIFSLFSLTFNFFRFFNRKFIYPSRKSTLIFSLSLSLHHLLHPISLCYNNISCLFFVYLILLSFVTRELNIDDGNVTWQLKITRYLTLNGWLKIDIQLCTKDE